MLHSMYPKLFSYTQHIDELTIQKKATKLDNS